MTMTITNDNDIISNIHTYLQIRYLQVSYLQYHCCVLLGDQYSINAVFLLTPDDHQVCGRVCDGIDRGRDPSQEGGIIY